LTNGTTTTTYATTATNNTGFNWSLSNPAAGSIGATTGLMTWANGFFGTVNIQVTANGCNGPSPMVIRTVVITPSVGTPIFTLGGSTTRCQGPGIVTYDATATNSTGITYSLDATSLAAGNTIVATTGAVTYVGGWVGLSIITAMATGCNGPSTASHVATSNPRPGPSISGPASICVGTSGIVYTTEAGMSAYTWGVSAGGIITGGVGTNTITVSWNTPGAQSITVNYTNGFNCPALVPTIFDVNVTALPVPTITGITSMCVNSGYYSYTTEAGMSNYVWTVSSGGIIYSGLWTNQIQVMWNGVGSQTVSVNYSNGIGCTGVSPTVLDVTVNALPAQAGNITGTAIVCAGANGVPYSVSPINGASTYIWNLPPNATIATGAGTNSITVNYALNVLSGNITVLGNNLCGNGIVSPNFAMTVNPIPPAPVVTNTGYTLYSSASTGNQWYFEGNLLPGATGQTYLATAAGYYWSVVNINGCTSDTSNHKYIVVTGLEPHPALVINLYPIPNDGRFTVSITTSSQEDFSILVYNNMGIIIYEEDKVVVDGSLNQVIDLRPIPNGVYTVIFKTDKDHVVKRIVINK
jgi:hypothetical protein